MTLLLTQIKKENNSGYSNMMWIVSIFQYTTDCFTASGFVTKATFPFIHFDAGSAKVGIAKLSLCE